MATISTDLPDELVMQLRQSAERENMSADEAMQIIGKYWLEQKAKLDAASDKAIEENTEVDRQRTKNEVLEQRRYLRAVAVAAGLSNPKILEQPLEADLSDEERLALARQFTGTKDLSQIIIEAREES